jgi:hypothetical protein
VSAWPEEVALRRARDTLVTVADTGQGSCGRFPVGFTTANAAFCHKRVTPRHEWLPRGMPGPCVCSAD